MRANLAYFYQGFLSFYPLLQRDTNNQIILSPCEDQKLKWRLTFDIAMIKEMRAHQGILLIIREIL